MCGICGDYVYGNGTPVDEGILVTMRDSMAHRGPDDAGIWISSDRRIGFGHRRLSIIDLSSAGRQPMCNEDGTVWIVLNGEIYNYQILRQELEQKGHRFRSRTDTEVIVHLYEEKGIELVEDLVGMFAFAVWDQKVHRLMLVRDRIGIKPLYYTWQNGRFLFASEIKALVAHPGTNASLNEQSLFDYLTYSVVPAPDTLFKNIFKLPPAHILTVESDGKHNQKCYWNIGRYLPRSDRPQISLDNYIDRLKNVLRESIKARMISDVPFGVFLSGGVDSSTNVALMAELMDRPVEAFSVGYKEKSPYNEMTYARRIAKLFGAHYHEVLIDERDFLDLLPQLAFIQDEPLPDPVCIPLYYLAKLAKESGVTVIQIGEGSDELFGGYDRYLNDLEHIRRYWGPLKSIPAGFLKAIQMVLNPIIPQKYGEFVWRAANQSEYVWGSAIAFGEISKRGLLRRDYYNSIVKTKKSDFFASKILSELSGNKPVDDLVRMIYLEFRHRLPELLLMRVDKIAMAHSLETRVPFLDHRLVELALDIPSKLKIRGKTGKYVLKKAVEGLLPNHIIYRPKIGFGGNSSNMFTPGIRSFAYETILDTSDLFQWLNRDYVEILFHDKRNDNSFQIWNLMNFTLWYHEWIRK